MKSENLLKKDYRMFICPPGLTLNIANIFRVKTSIFILLRRSVDGRNVHAQYSRFWRFMSSLLRACFQYSMTGSMGFLLQPLPWQRQVLVPFKTVAWHFEWYWEELENGGRRKQLVNISTLLFFQRHVARQRSLFLLQSFVRRQLLLHTPVDLLQWAYDSRQDAHDRLHCVLVISVIWKKIFWARISS